MNIPFLELDAHNLTEQDKYLLGPLQHFIGEWSNKDAAGTLNPQGWNLISIPGPKTSNPMVKGLTDGGFIFETIPYYETLSFTPIAVTANFGTFANAADDGSQEIQQIGALLYDQRVYSAGLEGLREDYPDKEELQAYFTKKNFNKGDAIHAEVGMLLNLSNFNADASLQIARMGNIPHGNTMLCLGTGQSGISKGPQIQAQVSQETLTPITENPKQSLPLAYASNTIEPNGGPTDRPFPFAAMDPRMPWTPLTQAIASADITSHTHLSLSTTRGTGGLLSIPFVGNTSVTAPTMDTTQMDVDYWLSEDANGAQTLQYFQNIRIVFPFTGDVERRRVVWPHIGMNTLTKQG